MPTPPLHRLAPEVASTRAYVSRVESESPPVIDSKRMPELIRWCRARVKPRTAAAGASDAIPLLRSLSRATATAIDRGSDEVASRLVTGAAGVCGADRDAKWATESGAEGRAVWEGGAHPACSDGTGGGRWAPGRARKAAAAAEVASAVRAIHRSVDGQAASGEGDTGPCEVSDVQAAATEWRKAHSRGVLAVYVGHYVEDLVAQFTGFAGVSPFLAHCAIPALTADADAAKRESGA